MGDVRVHGQSRRRVIEEEEVAMDDTGEDEVVLTDDSDLALSGESAVQPNDMPQPDDARAQHWKVAAIQHLRNEVDVHPDAGELGRRRSVAKKLQTADRVQGTEESRRAARQLVSQSDERADYKNELLNVLQAGTLDQWYSILSRKDNYPAMMCQ